MHPINLAKKDHIKNGCLGEIIIVKQLCVKQHKPIFVWFSTWPATTPLNVFIH